MSEDPIQIDNTENTALMLRNPELNRMCVAGVKRGFLDETANKAGKPDRSSHKIYWGSALHRVDHASP